MEQGGNPGIRDPKIREVYQHRDRLIIRAGTIWKVGGSRRKVEAELLKIEHMVKKTKKV